VRTCKTAVVEQQHVFPARRGVVWDLRTKGDDGLYGPADFQAPITTHLDTAWWAQMLAFYPDQEIVGTVIDGAQFRAEVPLAAVLNPHLLSVAAAADKIDNEHTRLADCGYYGVSPNLPFFPLWLTAQGSVPKSDGRARPVQDASMPREDLFYVNGEPVVSINVASGAGRRERDAAIAAGAEPKWPHEVKPTTADSNVAPSQEVDALVIKRHHRRPRLTTLDHADHADHARPRLIKSPTPLLYKT